VRARWGMMRKGVWAHKGKHSGTAGGHVSGLPTHSTTQHTTACLPSHLVLPPRPPPPRPIFPSVLSPLFFCLFPSPALLPNNPLPTHTWRKRLVCSLRNRAALVVLTRTRAAARRSLSSAARLAAAAWRASWPWGVGGLGGVRVGGWVGVGRGRACLVRGGAHSGR
jgi:hypothetical protein